jgi:F1F0 ATPase subunit 2
MSEPVALVLAPFLAPSLAWMAGCMLGVIFYGGLWWTVRQGVSSTRPALWFSASLLLRVTIALGGFYFVGAGHWVWLVLCLLGFSMTRLAVTWMTRVKPVQVASHAS